MDILVSSNFERLLWFFAYQTDKASTADERRQHACQSVSSWLNKLKTEGGFQVPTAVIEAAKAEFESERVSNEETISTIRNTYKTCFPTDLPAGSPRSSKTGGYILDPHTAVGVAASRRSIQRNPGDSHISLSTAHPAKFSDAVATALKDEASFDFEAQVLPDELKALLKKETRVTDVENSWEAVREIIKAQVAKELKAEENA